MIAPSTAGGTYGRSGILYYVMQQDLPLDLACKGVAIEQAACRPCLPPQTEPVCTESCTDDVLNSKFDNSGQMCGSILAYWPRRENKADVTSNKSLSCARVAVEKESACGACLPPNMSGADLCGTEACTNDVLFAPSTAGGTCGSGIL